MKVETIITWEQISCGLFGAMLSPQTSKISIHIYLFDTADADKEHKNLFSTGGNSAVVKRDDDDYLDDGVDDVLGDDMGDDGLVEQEGKVSSMIITWSDVAIQVCKSQYLALKWC